MLIYNIILLFFIIFLFPIIIPYIIISDKRRKTFLYRLGISDFLIDKRRYLKNKKTIWIHALSVGEVFSSISLVKALRKNLLNYNICFSASTMTGIETAYKNLQKDIDCLLYFPYDFFISVKYFIQKLNPNIVLIIESDIWPQFIFELKKKKIPIILVNARLSESSFLGYKSFSFISNSIFNSFTNICAQSKEDEIRFKKLGVNPDKISITGNLKFDQIYEKDNFIFNIPEKFKIIVAGSTHPGEEAIILDSFFKLKKNHQNLKLIIAPRDPKRSVNIYNLFESAGFKTILMDKFNNSINDIDVIIVNFIGVLKKLYAIADIAFIGGSLINFRGHNPLEPAIFSKPIIFGQYMDDFKEISDMLIKIGGAIKVIDSFNLYNALDLLLCDLKKAKAMGSCAYKIYSENQNSLKKTMKIIKKVELFYL